MNFVVNPGQESEFFDYLLKDVETVKARGSLKQNSSASCLRNSRVVVWVGVARYYGVFTTLYPPRRTSRCS